MLPSSPQDICKIYNSQQYMTESEIKMKIKLVQCTLHADMITLHYDALSPVLTEHTATEVFLDFVCLLNYSLSW